MFWRLIGRKFLSVEWRPRCGVWFYYTGSKMRRRLLEEYREVYFWPWIEVKRLYVKYRRKIIYEYHLIRRTADKKLLKEPIFAKLAQDTARVRGFKLVGVRPCRTGRPDQGWSMTYDLLVKTPAHVWEVLSLSTSDRAEYLAKKNLDARVHFSSRSNDRELILTICGHVLKDQYEWGNRYLEFLKDLAA
jgi:hypothetical protein